MSTGSRSFLANCVDASGQGLGAVLEQAQADGRLHTIAYASQTLSAAETCYGITDMEALGIV